MQKSTSPAQKVYWNKKVRENKMSSANQSLSFRKMVDISNVDHFRFTVVTAEWNSEITFALRDACIEALTASGVPEKNISIRQVPGSWELVSAARLAVALSETDAVICIGCIIRGETPHFEYISQGVTVGLANLCANQDVPVIYGILTVDSLQQAIDRAGGKYGNKGHEAAVTALEMVLYKRHISDK